MDVASSIVAKAEFLTKHPSSCQGKGSVPLHIFLIPELKDNDLSAMTHSFILSCRLVVQDFFNVTLYIAFHIFSWPCKHERTFLG
jgi:hypothetical protein